MISNFSELDQNEYPNDHEMFMDDDMEYDAETYDHVYDDQDNEEWLWEDVCCWHPKYQGPQGSCHCRKIAEADRYENQIHIRVLRFIQYKILNVKSWWGKLNASFKSDDYIDDDLPF